MATVDDTHTTRIPDADETSLVSEIADTDEAGAEALAAAVGQSFVDDEGGDDASSSGGTVDLKKLLHAEVAPSKSLVIIWILFAAELGFDLITTAIAFVATMSKSTQCCGHTVYMGPLPMTTAIPFFFLIIAEITFLVRAILLTLWPSIFEAARVAAHGKDEDGEEDDQIGFEVNIEKTGSESTAESDEETSSESSPDDDSHTDSKAKEGTKEEPEAESKSGAGAADDPKTGSNSPDGTATAADDEGSASDKGVESSSVGSIEDTVFRETDPEFVETTAARRQKSGFWKRACCSFLKWNARVVLAVLNLLTLANPFFGCLIAYILLYQSDKNESFVVLGIESLSIILHFVSVRMEGGLRTWYSKLLHSVILLPFLVTVILVLVFLREGGMCYTVETKLFRFTGCEVCPDTLLPPVDGMCGNSTLEGIGGFREELGNIKESFHSFGNLKNIASIAARGAHQDEYCSEETNFCFFEF